MLSVYGLIVVDLREYLHVSWCNFVVCGCSCFDELCSIAASMVYIFCALNKFATTATEVSLERCFAMLSSPGWNPNKQQITWTRPQVTNGTS